MRSITIAIVSLLFFSSVRAQRVRPDIIHTSRGSLTIQPLVHATFVMTLPGQAIYVDPTGGAKTFAGLQAPDLILITDIHGDHYDPRTLAAVRKAGTVIVAPKAVADLMPDSLKGKLVILGNGEKTSLEGIGIAAIPMYNLPVDAAHPLHPKGRGNGYILSIGGKRIYISGDTQGIPEMRALQDIDVAFVCMNLPYTMDVSEAADAVLAFKPRIVYPYHYRGQNGLSDVGAFKAKVEAGNKYIEVRLRNWYPAAK